MIPRKKCVKMSCYQPVWSKGLCKYHSAQESLNNPTPRMQKYYELRDAYMKEHETCEYEGCNAPSVDLHHCSGRTGDNLYRTFMAVCRQHHVYIETHPRESYDKGYLIKRNFKQTNEPPEYGC